MRFLRACIDGSQTLESRFLFFDLTANPAKTSGHVREYRCVKGRKNLRGT